MVTWFQWEWALFWEWFRFYWKDGPCPNCGKMPHSDFDHSAFGSGCEWVERTAT